MSIFGLKWKNLSRSADLMDFEKIGRKLLFYIVGNTINSSLMFICWRPSPFFGFGFATADWNPTFCIVVRGAFFGRFCWWIPLVSGRLSSFGLFAGWFLGWFGLAGADFMWEKNTVGWLVWAGWNQQANRLFLWHLIFICQQFNIYLSDICNLYK